MIIKAANIAGAYHIEIDRLQDDRGCFARLWCVNEFREHRIEFNPVQISMSHNSAKGTLRGLHFQRAPSNEAKLVRCSRGSIYDVILDLRPDSSTFLQHESVKLSAEQCNALFIPAGVAHGFQTLEDDSELNYIMSDFYDGELADGFRFDDPAFGISWPLPVVKIADRDKNYPDFDRDAFVSRSMISFRED